MPFPTLRSLAVLSAAMAVSAHPAGTLRIIVPYNPGGIVQTANIRLD